MPTAAPFLIAMSGHTPFLLWWQQCRKFPLIHITTHYIHSISRLPIAAGQRLHRWCPLLKRRPSKCWLRQRGLRQHEFLGGTWLVQRIQKLNEAVCDLCYFILLPNITFTFKTFYYDFHHYDVITLLSHHYKTLSQTNHYVLLRVHDNVIIFTHHYTLIRTYVQQ